MIGWVDRLVFCNIEIELIIFIFKLLVFFFICWLGYELNYKVIRIKCYYIVGVKIILIIIDYFKFDVMESFF